MKPSFSCGFIDLNVRNILHNPSTTRPFCDIFSHFSVPLFCHQILARHHDATTFTVSSDLVMLDSTMTANMESTGLTAVSWWTVDTSKELPMTVGATPLVKNCMQAHGWSLEFAQQVLDGYKKLLTFMNMFQDYNATKFYPPIPVDKMWHQHTLDTATYESDCHFLFGRMIQRPDDLAALDEETKNRRIERTLYVLRLQCKDDFDRTVWDFGRPVDAADKTRNGLRPRTNRVDWSKKLDGEVGSTTLRQYSSKKRKGDSAAEERKRRRTQDGCLRPHREPILKEDGTFSKPKGRVPQGMTWDPIRGLYAPSDGAVAKAKTPRKVKVETPPSAALKKRSSSTRERSTKRTTPDGCVLPLREPKRNSDGTFVRPCGRVPTGMVWDENRGVFAPVGQISSPAVVTSALQPPPPRQESKQVVAATKKTPVSHKREVSKKSIADDHRRGQRTPDGCFRPAVAPRQKADGTYVRPKGRGPANMVWNVTRGLFVPHETTSDDSMRAVPCVTPTTSVVSDGDDIFDGAGTRANSKARRVSTDMGH